MLPVAVWVDVSIATTIASCISATPDAWSGVVLDDEVVPVGDPEVPVRANLGDDW